MRSDEADHAPEGASGEGPSLGRTPNEASDAQRGVTAQRLAALALASGDDDLVELQASGFAPERTPSLDRLRLAHALVAEIGEALETNTADAWSVVTAAMAAVRNAADDALTDRDPEPGAPAADEMGVRSTDLPPPPPVDATVPRPPLVAPQTSEGPASEPTAVSASPVDFVPEETMISPAPVVEALASASSGDPLAEHTLAEAGLIESAVERARDLIDATSGSSPATRLDGPPSSGGTIQMSYASLAHGFALTMEEYAALCAERDRDPSRLRALRARYGIPEPRGHHALDRYFEQLFARDPSMRALWERHYRHYAAIFGEGD